MDNSPQDFATITKNASKTFYIASLFFPKHIRKDVYVLYSFLRISDDLVDSIPPKEIEFKKFQERAYQSMRGDLVGIAVIDRFAELAQRKGISTDLIRSYFRSQELDLKMKSYGSYQDVCEFIYGVADVVGLCMARLMDLPDSALPGAAQFGHAMQLVNIIRDIEEDACAGKVYLPQQELKKFHLPSMITEVVVQQHKEDYCAFIHFQLKRALNILNEGEKNIDIVPSQYRHTLRIIAQAYRDVIERIRRDPFVIFHKKVKPSIGRLLSIAVHEYFRG